MKFGRLKPGRYKQSPIQTIGVMVLVFALLLAGCFKGHEPVSYYGRIVVPRSQEFRWSDGGLPQTFDPAFAAAPPDTDAVRALFEGLTDYDPKTLAPIPAVATRWESASEGRVWTFYLRTDAKWSNGEQVTASDFVRSWQRTLRIGPLAPHTELLTNIEGSTVNQEPPTVPKDVKVPAPMAALFGAEAVNDHVLRVRLRQPDESFPSLVAHPVFRPVKILTSEQTRRIEATEIISNGAFQLSQSDGEHVLLERAHTYWDGSSVALQRVSFVNSKNAESALSAYRAGEVDAVTNAPFEPLALKLFAGYKDFRRSTYGALTYYKFNAQKAPFDDVRVREALAIAIDRERVSRDHLGGATEPAGKFLPDSMTEEKPVVEKTQLLELDVAKARELLEKAGYPDGNGFPVIRLLINRNEQQRVVAEAIASMWRSALNVETEIVMKNWDEYEAAIKAGDYDVARRGIVMQTTDAATNLRLIFDLTNQEAQLAAEVVPEVKLNGKQNEKPIARKPADLIDSEEQALKELKAMPIYFASSYSLVKPYISSFDSNVLDMPLLKRTRIDTTWLERKP